MDIAKLKERGYKKKKNLPRYAIWVTHRISIRVVGLLENRDVSPNTITLISIITGIIAGVLFFSPSTISYFIGAIILELYYVLDAVDGQYARVKGRTSFTGAYFDYISNHIVQSLVFLGIGIGMYNQSKQVFFLLAGFFSAWGMLFIYIIFDARHSVLLNRGKKIVEEGGEKTRDSFLKKLFMIMHKSCTYPTIMNLISLLALVSILVKIPQIKSLILFKILIIYYAIALNLVWMAKLAKSVIRKELDS